MIETLFVLVILGVIAGMAMPVMERGVARSKADRAAATISNDLRSAYSLAARQGKPVRILFNAANRTITIQDRASGTVFVRRDLTQAKSAYGLTSMTVSVPTLDVFPNGLASSSLLIQFNVNTNARAVRMSRVGQIRYQ